MNGICTKPVDVSFYHSLSVSLSLSHTHTHTLSLSLSLNLALSLCVCVCVCLSSSIEIAKRIVRNVTTNYDIIKVKGQQPIFISTTINPMEHNG